MERQRNPKLEIEKGKTYKFTLKESFNGESPDKKKNDGTMRPWYGYNIIYNSIDYTTFVDKTLFDELNRYSSGSVVEVTDTLDIQMAVSKNKTQIKIEVFASMKIASAISTNLDELKSNTHDVMALHKEICEEIKNENEVAKNEEELF